MNRCMSSHLSCHVISSNHHLISSSHPIISSRLIISSHILSSHLISSSHHLVSSHHLISSRLISSYHHFASPHLITSSHLILIHSSHPVSFCLILSHFVSFRLISCSLLLTSAHFCSFPLKCGFWDTSAIIFLFVFVFIYYESLLFSMRVLLISAHFCPLHIRYRRVFTLFCSPAVPQAYSRQRAIPLDRRTSPNTSKLMPCVAARAPSTLRQTCNPFGQRRTKPQRQQVDAFRRWCHCLPGPKWKPLFLVCVDGSATISDGRGQKPNARYITTLLASQTDPHCSKPLYHCQSPPLLRQLLTLCGNKDQNLRA